MDGLLDFFSHEAGQRRRRWLDQQSREVGGLLDYYLGPTGIPDRLGAVAGLLEFTDAGDMPAAADASRSMWNNPTIGNAAELTAAGAALALPMYSARMGEGIADLAGEAVRAYNPNVVNSNPFGKPTSPQGIRAYHGSPHDFDRFQMDKIGTGEGAQAYGHGLYFAEAEDTARFYRDNYAKPDPKHFTRDSGRQLAQDQLQAWAGDVPGGVDDLKASLRKMETKARFFGADDADKVRMEDLRDAIAYMDQGAPRGRMYEVNIKADPDDFLDWDAPLSEQPLKVQRGLMDLPGSEKFDSDWIGAQLYESNVLTPGQYRDNRAATQALELDAGIPGIRYRDAGSRGLDGAEGTRNFVVFDENLIEIVRKYGIAGAAAMLGMSASQVEAQLNGQQQQQPQGLLGNP